MNPTTPSDRLLKDGELTNPYSSKITRKEYEEEDKTKVHTDEKDKFDETESTSSAAEQPVSKKPRNPMWKVVEMNTTIIRLTNEL